MEKRKQFDTSLRSWIHLEEKEGKRVPREIQQLLLNKLF